MKKIITAFVLTLAISAPTFAEGITPIVGFAGNTPHMGREGHIPIMGRDGNTPHTGRSAPANNTKDNILSGLINALRNIWF